jgi:hypothetical protein
VREVAAVTFACDLHHRSDYFLEFSSFVLLIDCSQLGRISCASHEP